MKILIIVMTTLDGGLGSELYEKQRSTWDSVNTPNVETLYYIGGGDKKEIRGNLSIDVNPETKANTSLKMVTCLELTQDWDYDYIFHTNASSYVDKKLLYEWLLDKPRFNFYSGVVGDMGGGVLFASGCGFSISKDVAKLIINHQNEWGCSDINDVTLGVLLTRLGLQIYPASRMDLGYNFTENVPIDYFHYRCKTENLVSTLDSLQSVHDHKKMSGLI